MNVRYLLTTAMPAIKSLSILAVTFFVVIGGCTVSTKAHGQRVIYTTIGGGGGTTTTPDPVDETPLEFERTLFEGEIVDDQVISLGGTLQDLINEGFTRVVFTGNISVSGTPAVRAYSSEFVFDQFDSADEPGNVYIIGFTGSSSVRLRNTSVTLASTGFIIDTVSADVPLGGRMYMEVRVEKPVITTVDSPLELFDVTPEIPGSTIIVFDWNTSTFLEIEADDFIVTTNPSDSTGSSQITFPLNTPTTVYVIGGLNDGFNTGGAEVSVVNVAGNLNYTLVQQRFFGNPISDGLSWNDLTQQNSNIGAFTQAMGDFLFTLHTGLDE